MNKHVELLLHAAVWFILFLTPLSFLNHGGGVSILQYLMVCMAPFLLVIVFYANYLWLTPKYFVEGEKRYYWLVNVVLCVGLGIGLHLWVAFMHTVYDNGSHHPEPTTMQVCLFVLRDIFNFALAAATATTIQLSLRWYKSEQARREAEAARVDAELRNLRNQINPHFLLNTLNNIYALTAFDTERAQQAIEQLSHLLRHLLYENEQPLVSFADEADFLRNYVNLMKIRLAQTVETTFDVALRAPDVKVTPMLFISLVENAFKHGVSSTEPSFIHISMEADRHQIVCDIENSNFPKTAGDHSGHGIGLSQVQRRLDLAYPGRYTWEKGVSDNGKTYHSRITLTI